MSTEPPPGVSDEFWCKNRLQEYTQRASIPLPIYLTYNEGAQHAPQFRSQVWVDGTCFESPNIFSNRKMAEQDASKYALAGIREKVKAEGCSRILEDIVFCKSIINEYAVKMSMTTPIYTTKESKALLPIFVSSLELNGITYIGDAGRNKKEAEQYAARSAISSILDSESGTTMSEIVKSKFKLYDALKKVVKDSSTIQTSTIQASTVNTIQASTVNTMQASAVNTMQASAVSTMQASVVSTIPASAVGTIPGSTVAAIATGVTPDNSLVSFSKQKEVEVGEGSARDSVATILQSSLSPFPTIELVLSEPTIEQPSHPISTHESLHVFKKPRPDISSVAVTPPIVFVPPALEQASENPPVFSTSSKKRNRKNKKAKKKLLNQSHGNFHQMRPHMIGEFNLRCQYLLIRKFSFHGPYCFLSFLLTGLQLLQCLVVKSLLIHMPNEKPAFCQVLLLLLPDAKHLAVR